MRIRWHTVPLRLREPLRISRSVTTERHAVWLSLHHAGHTGRGEVVTSVHRRLDTARVTALLRHWAPRWCDRGDPERLREALPGLAADLADAPGVVMALDTAVHDLLGRLRGVPVHRLVGAPRRPSVPTARTIGIVDAEHAARAAARAAAHGFEVLKLKLGAADFPADLRRVARVRAAAPGVRLLVDPNGAWSPQEAVRHLAALVPHSIEAVEQPTAPGRPDRLAWVAEHTDIPVIADEDAADLDDVRRLVGPVAGVNVKLAECGGIAAALRLVDAARAAGRHVMLGCQAASSLSIAPAVHLAGHARWVDLDGHLLLESDPWRGIGGADGRLRQPDLPGLGIRPATKEYAPR